MDPDIPLPDVDTRALQSMIKMGGKKKLDSLIEMVKATAPQRLKELAEAADLAEAQSAARALKASAANLGLSALEDACDRVIREKSWTAGHALAREAQSLYSRALPELARIRKTL